MTEFVCSFQLDFTNVIAEPDESSYSFPFVHRVAGQVYHYSKVFVYRLLTIVIGLPLMLFWGLLFGVYTFGMIWFVAPMRRLMQSCISEVGIYIQAISDAIIAPISRSYGNIFSRIQIKLSTEQIHAIKQLQV